jgi:hypothetical protein
MDWNADPRIEVGESLITPFWMLAVIRHVTNSAKYLTFTPLERACPTI